MKAQAQTTLVYLGEEEKVSQAGRPYTQIKLGNPEEYQNYTFFKTDSVLTSEFKQGEKVKALLEVVPQGFRNNINLVGLIKAN